MDKVCFVIMGFGEKTDYRHSRTLNLDKTYNNIIKPACQETGYKCIRADEISNTGIIDVPMYKYLLSADVVIADVSTYNPNALYELGVRHALRPYSTIVISEDGLEYPFDISHTKIALYEHLGKGIDFDEVMRFKGELVNLLNHLKDNIENDSPVYTYLNELNPPKYKKEELEAEIKKEKVDIKSLNSLIESAENCLSNTEFLHAKDLFLQAQKRAPNNEYLKQRIVLCTYKSKVPNEFVALTNALVLIEQLNPKGSTNPETLGLHGAITKRLWEISNPEVGTHFLNKSIFSYEKGFYLKHDYYNGINLAFLLNVRAFHSSGNDRVADFVLANRVRNNVVEICRDLLQDPDFEKLDDKYWIVATLEEAYFGLSDEDEYKKYRDLSKTLTKVGWKRESTESQINKLKDCLNIEL